MNVKFNRVLSVVSIFLVLCMATNLFGGVVFAEDGTESWVEYTNTEITFDPSEAITPQWTVTSNLTYVLDEDNFAWTVYQDNYGDAVFAGYEMTGTGHWSGVAEIQLTVINHLSVDVEFVILCRNEISAFAAEIAKSYVCDEDTGVTYNEETQRFVLEGNGTGIVRLKVTDQMLQSYNMHLTEEENVIVLLQVQLVSPTELPAQTITEEMEETEPDETTEVTQETEETDPTEVIEMIEITEATEPTEVVVEVEMETIAPTETTEPTAGFEETIVTEPTEETKETDVTEPMEEPEETEVTEPTEETQETEATDPTRESHEMETINPTEGTHEMEPIDPTEETLEMEPIEPTEETQEMEATESTEETVESTAQTESVEESGEPDVTEESTKTTESTSDEENENT